jgi:hypothetical protein
MDGREDVSTVIARALVRDVGKTFYVYLEGHQASEVRVRVGADDDAFALKYAVKKQFAELKLVPDGNWGLWFAESKTETDDAMFNHAVTRRTFRNISDKTTLVAKIRTMVSIATPSIVPQQGTSLLFVLSCVPLVVIFGCVLRICCVFYVFLV